jgi:bifunctional non-homologous end joining protein LigD
MLSSEHLKREMARPNSRTKIPFRVSPMLATLVPNPFHKPNWVYEEKYDGIRILAYKEGEEISLITRNDINRTRDFPKIAAAVSGLTASTLLLDGEVVMFDQKGVSRFQLLQRRMGDAKYALFDCLFVNGRDLRSAPLSVRRENLEGSVRFGNVLLLSARLAEDGFKAYRIAERRGFEGVVAKAACSPYVEGRSRYWLKVKVQQEEEFIIGGYTPPAGSRKYFGALLLGAYEQGVLRYVGKVGTGFDEKTLRTLFRKFQSLKRKEPAFVPPPRIKNATFLSPQLVAQVTFTEWTRDGKLRHPVFLGLREDKSAKEVVLQKH